MQRRALAFAYRRQRTLRNSKPKCALLSPVDSKVKDQARSQMRTKPKGRCRALNRSSPGSLLPQLPAHRDLVLGPFKGRYTLINVPRRRVNRNIRYTVVIRGRAVSPELPLSRICATAANFNARVLARR